MNQITELRIIQKVLIKDKNKYLFIKRSETDEHNAGKWDLPGGKLRVGELPEDAIRREVLEEVNLQVDSLKPVFILSFLQDGIYAVIIIYSSELLSGKIVLSSEHIDYRWCIVNDVKDLDIQNWLKKDIDKILDESI